MAWRRRRQATLEVRSIRSIRSVPSIQSILSIKSIQSIIPTNRPFITPLATASFAPRPGSYSYPFISRAATSVCAGAADEAFLPSSLGMVSSMAPGTFSSSRASLKTSLTSST